MSKRQKRKAVFDTELKAKKLKGETDLGNGLHWKHVDADLEGACPLITLRSDTLDGAEKIAGFDIDCTIIKTVSGRTFAIGSNDWQFWHDKVPERLKALHKNGYRVVFFTNQGGIEKKKVTPQIFKDKMEAIIKELDIPVLVLASTGENQYRKPSPRVWEYFLKSCNQGKQVKLSECVYVGDAAGRAKNWAKDKPKDFSCSDRMFAANIGVKFATPEEFFLEEKPAPFTWGSFNAEEFLKKNPATTVNNAKATYASKKPEVIVMVGPPASGKSTFRKRYFESAGYLAVNRDTMGTVEKCIKVAKEATKSGKSVVADNTNPSVSARANFVNIAKEKGIQCRCFWMQTPLDLSHHLNMFRQTQTEGKVRRIPDVGYNMFKKNFEEPTTAEGFSEVIKIDFKPIFDKKDDETLFKKWT